MRYLQEERSAAEIYPKLSEMNRENVLIEVDLCFFSQHNHPAERDP